MDVEIKEKRILLLKNTKDKDTQPDFKGKMMIEGIMYDVSLWARKTPKSIMLSGEIRLEEERISAEDILGDDFVPDIEPPDDII